MNFRLTHIVPTSIELVGGFFATLVIVLLANSQRLLNYYGLHSSDVVIKTSASSALNDTLKAIDSFSLTNTFVSFLIWALVGVLCFGILEALGSAYEEFRLEQEVSSQRYIHPSTFTRVKFWRGVFINTWSLAFGLIVLGAYSMLLLLAIIPLGLAYSRVFLLDVSLANTVYFAAGLLIIFFGLLLLNVVVRFLLHRRRIFDLG